MVGLLSACGPSMETIELPTAVVDATVLSPSVLDVAFEVTNPRDEDLESVTCVPSAYVGTNVVSRFLSGGTLPSLDARETRTVTLSVEVREQQAGFVSRVEVYCTSRATVLD